MQCILCYGYSIAAGNVDAGLRRHGRKRLLLFGASIVLFMASGLFKVFISPGNIWYRLVPWLMLGGALPFVSLASFLAILVFQIRSRPGPHSQSVPLAMWSVFAFVLLGKIILSSRVYHYGFALAMPAALTLVACVLQIAPGALRKLDGGGEVFRRLALVMLIADVIFFMKISNAYYDSKNIGVGSGGDMFLTAGPETDPRGAVVVKALAEIQRLAPTFGTMVVLPEGVTLNYISRRVNPTPYINFMPPELEIFGEEKVLAAMQKHPPEFILLAPKDTSEYGVGPFGEDLLYGKQIMDWVKKAYSTVEEISSGPASTAPFTITILKRRTHF